MTSRRTFDPRSVAREIPGIFEAIFPQLTPGVVSAFNRDAKASRCAPIPPGDVKLCKLQHAMLFEIGFSVGEMLIGQGKFEWERCIEKATQRQRRYFDAVLPDKITENDQQVAIRTGENINSMIMEISETRKGKIILEPRIPGYQWISSGHGDFSIEETLIEVKCTSNNFSSPDYRQILMYWLLSYARSIESDGTAWSEGVLLNPRLGKHVTFRFDELLAIVSGGKSTVEILSLFSSLVGTRNGT